MGWYYYIAWVAIISQLVFSVQMLRNFRYALKKYKRQRSWYRPKTALFVPCKGHETDFEKNITSFFNLNYENYILWFVVADKDDPAYPQLCRLKDKLSRNSKALDVRILIAGQISDKPESSKSICSQKIHNLLHCYNNIPDDIEIMAFADSDACLRPDWLSHLVYPLHQEEKNGAATGYRWFIPKKNNLASLVLSAINAKIAQLLGNSRFNLAWGGSMAIRVDLFRQIGLDKIWQNSLSDDLSLSYAVKKTGKKIIFVPACLVASHESTTWPELFEFARRQFLITRISAPKTWCFGLCSSFYAVLGLWAGTAMAIYAALIADKNLSLYVTVPALFFISQLARAILRQKMVRKLLKKEKPKIRYACIVDILFFWIWTLMLLVFIISSAFGRVICWRGIRYKLLGPTKTVVLDS